ncbi:nth: endonuclease III [Rubrobacter radiotolerans]|uniref:Endonuclease III n=1 Tax=Rubrobacter radiotolerans TaxID=42256 RepID=A0A023X5L6_RUBRA|nr:endonuclease III [Rubrobacter radiotolerans]AHY47603.1 nth: endonuclease III [Rubrobacter radiotolerans]MDX5895008.1 endonuclease III [Rubrobacter radiotolerans]SMC07260.1 DNA-(apurinic or apyrimidinic site) lyase /endonuclease III [Rubrobacter radiotolerans DSM 5868]
MTERREQTERRAAPFPEVFARLSAEYPGADTELRWSDPLELLVAVILSAQSTDVRVNAVTESLFRKYRSPEDYLAVAQEELEEDIRPAGFFRNKAKAIQGMARRLIEAHDGEVPRSMEDLVALPGVGRKTANVVLGNAFGINEGVVVDTHVKRLANRLGLTENTDPEKVERDLLPLVPENDRTVFSHLLILHGRRVCKARKPLCEACVLSDLCPSSRV